MKYALFVAAFAIAILPVHGQEKTPKADSHQNNPDNPQSHRAQSVPTVGINVINQETPTPQSDGPQHGSKNYLSRLFSPENLPNIGLLIAGIIGIVVAFRTLGAMRDSSEKQLRAYVVQEMGAIVNVADPIPSPGLIPTDARITHPNWGPVVRLQIKNTGQTPALQVRNWGSICFREYPLTSVLPSADERIPPMYSILGPGIPSTKTLTFGPRLTSQQIAALRNGTSAIYVHGEIHYRDVFGKAHITRYRLMHNNASGPIGITTDLTFTEEGNEAD